MMKCFLSFPVAVSQYNPIFLGTSPFCFWMSGRINVAFAHCTLHKFRQKYKYKDKDKDKDNDKDKDADRITETLLVCYIFGILMTQAFQV